MNHKLSVEVFLLVIFNLTFPNLSYFKPTSHPHF